MSALGIYGHSGEEGENNQENISRPHPSVAATKQNHGPTAMPNRVFDMELVLQQILSYLSFQDLLRCSLVSRHWNYHARFVLRNHRTCFCRIRALCPCCSTCEEDLEFFTVLSRSNILPFNGLSFIIEIGHFRHCTCHLCSSFPSWCHKFLNQIRVKCLKLRWTGERLHPAVYLLETALRKKGSEIEKLIVEDLPTSMIRSSSFAEYLLLEEISLPRLHTVSLQNNNGTSLMRPLRELIMVAPNLREIKGWTYPADVLILSQRGTAVKDLWIRPGFYNEALYQTISQNSFQLASLAVSSKHINESPAPDLFLETVKMLLISSRQTLQDLRMELALLLEIKRLGIMPFPAVTKIEIEYHYAADSRMLCHMDFPNAFPKLHSVVLTITAGSAWSSYPMRLTGMRAVTGISAASTVAKLEIQPGVLQSFPFQSLPMIRRVFNNVTHYRASRIENMVAQLDTLWEVYPHVESIVFVLRPHDLMRSIDWILCGIPLAEAEGIVDESDQFLGSLQYAAVRPPLTCFNRLRHFRLEIEHENCWCRSCKNKDKIISALTVQLVLRRMPQLSFEIKRNVCDCEDFPCNFTFDHLEPYVTLVL